MSDPIHDWWSHLNPFERAHIDLLEKQIDSKAELIAALRKKGGNRRRIDQLNLDIKGHRFMRQELVNRGVQRSRHGYKPKITCRDRRYQQETELNPASVAPRHVAAN